MGKYTKSPLGLVDGENSEFNVSTTGNSTSVKSIFSSQHTLEKPTGENQGGHVGVFESPLTGNNLHTDEKYNLSTNNIINQLLKIPSMKLKHSDFVYCRDYGVYPNNRLIICRRFGGPVGDSLPNMKASPVATLVSWFDDQQPPISIDFGITWTEADASFGEILNNIGTDIGLNKIGNLGDFVGKGVGLITLPGAFDPITRKILNKISPGLFTAGEEGEFIPAGAPNLIKEAKQRKLISDKIAGSSLKGSISVKVTCAWEQKFIGGIDPTKMYYDLLRTVLHFGTDDGAFYMGSGSSINRIMAKVLEALENPFDFIQNILSGFADAVKDAVANIKDLVTKFYDDQVVKKDSSTDGTQGTQGPQSKPGGLSEADQQKNNLLKEAKNTAISTLESLANAFQSVTKGLARKYKHPLMGVAAALSGAPSTPWHVTVGNPFRPILSTGDMYMSQAVKLTLGSTLAFNDLPSSISAEFTLENARSLGAGEIFRKLHTGEVRVTSKQTKTFFQDDAEDDIQASKSSEIPENPSGKPPDAGKDESTTVPTEPFALNKTNVASSTPTGTSPGANGLSTNPDPNSSRGPLVLNTNVSSNDIIKTNWLAVPPAPTPPVEDQLRFTPGGFNDPIEDLPQ